MILKGNSEVNHVFRSIFCLISLAVFIKQQSGQMQAFDP